MTLIDSIILAFVQGFTEFLPVSSSGHLTLFQKLIGITPNLSLDIFLNTATFLSVLFYFKDKSKKFVLDLKYIIIGTIPAVIVGLFFKSDIENLFSSTVYLPIFFTVTAFFLLLTKFLQSDHQPITSKKALVIGLFQAFAILPGISRSGSTIFAGLLLGLPLSSAFQFSFFLFIPASLGALILELKDSNPVQFLQPNLIFGFILSFLTGLIALKILQQTLQSRRLWLFSLYLIPLALFLLLSGF